MTPGSEFHILRVMSDKTQVQFRLSRDARELLESTAVELGVTRTAVIELAIREKAERHGVRTREDMLAQQCTCVHPGARVSQVDGGGVHTARCVVCGLETTGATPMAALQRPPLGGAPGEAWRQHAVDSDLYRKSVPVRA